MKAKRRLVTEESGLALPVAIMTVALLGVLGAGLLVFATTDLGIAAEENQSQRAFEMADAGVQAAKRQIDDDPRRSRYDADPADNLPWALQQGGVTLRDLDGDGNLTDRVKVTIESTGTETFRVISEGRYGSAIRKVEAVFGISGAVSIPRAYFARGAITLKGSADPVDVSFFSRTSITVNRSLGGTEDKYFGRWAASASSGSYPNPYNLTARSSIAPGVAAPKVDGSSVPGAGRVFTSTTSPRLTIPYGSTQDDSKIAFPFKVTNFAEDRQEIDQLRDQALALEVETGQPHYIDSTPGNGVDDPGLPNGGTDIGSWPSNSAYDTVVFYKYAAYNDKNNVTFKSGPSNPNPPCNTSQKGVIVVENGDATWASNRPFNGGIVVRAYNASRTNFHSSGGKFEGSGTPCIAGYVNTSGSMSMTGNIGSGYVEALSDLKPFNGAPQAESWRELYE